MAQIVGLDIGTRTIAGAVFSGNAKKFRLSDFFVRDIPTIASAASEAAGGEVAPPLSVAEVLQKVLSERGLLGADIIAGLDSKDCIIREVPVPFTRDEHIRKTILTEAESHFQTFDIEDVVLEYFKVEELGQKSRVLIAAVKKAAIRERLEVLQEAGVDPLALDLDATALFNAFALTPTFDPNRGTLLIDMGATSTKLLLVEKGELKKVRSIRIDSFPAAPLFRLPADPAPASRAPGSPPGAWAPPEAALSPIGSAYSIEARFEEIESALRRLEPVGGGEGRGLLTGGEPIAVLTDHEFELVRGGSSPVREEPDRFTEDEDTPEEVLPDRPADWPADRPEKPAGAQEEVPSENGAEAPPPRGLDYRDYLQRLGIEIQRTFAAASPATGVELICLTGGMSHREEARRFFRDEFDVETIDLDFGDSFPMNLPPEDRLELSRLGAVAVGLAMKELGGDRVGFDFRQKEFRFERKFERVKYPVLVVGLLTVLVFLQATFNLINENMALTERIRTFRKRGQDMFEAFFGKSNSSALLRPQADSEKRRWETLLGVGGANIPVFIPAIDALEEITRGVQDSGAGSLARLESMDLKLRTRTNRGKVTAESSSNLTFSTTEGGLATQVENAFRKPGGIFSASAGASSSASGTVKLTVTLTPQQKYLTDLSK